MHLNRCKRWREDSGQSDDVGKVRERILYAPLLVEFEDALPVVGICGELTGGGELTLLGKLQLHDFVLNGEFLHRLERREFAGSVSSSALASSVPNR
jgi:hypothetical protein